MEIAISINGVVRDLFGKIKQVHKKYYDSDVKEDLNYENIIELLDFKNDDELLEFLYREAPMEIFGHASETAPNFITQISTIHSHRLKIEFFELLCSGLLLILIFPFRVGNTINNFPRVFIIYVMSSAFRFCAIPF